VGATDLNHRLEGPEGAPVLVLSNSLRTALGMSDDQVPALRERFPCATTRAATVPRPHRPAPTRWTISAGTFSPCWTRLG
jgi:hypothetical protein